MEYKSYRINTHILLCLMMTGCGYLTNDKVNYIEEITNKVYLYKQENDKSVNLVFKESEEIYAEIVSNCLEVYYDSSRKIIYVKKLINSSLDRYYKIKLLDEADNTISNSIKKEVISKSDFKHLTNNKILKKWVLNENLN